MNSTNTADGGVEMWVNQTPTVSYSNVMFRADAPADFRSIELYRQDSINLYRYEDKYTMTTTWVGCRGGREPTGAGSQGGSGRAAAPLAPRQTRAALLAARFCAG